MAEKAVVEVEIEITSFSYRLGNPWVEVEGKLIVGDGPWLNFNQAIPMSDCHDDIKAMSDRLARAINNKSLDLEETADV